MELIFKNKNINFNLLLHDLVGGLTAAVVALPIALAFGVASGLGPTAGIYGAIMCGFFAALFGGTQSQVSGPTGPMTIVIASVVAASPGRPDLIFAAIIVAGILQVILAKIKAGQLIEYIPYPVVSGFMTGIGLIIIILELPILFGKNSTGKVFDAITSIPSLLNELSPNCLTLGLLTIASVYVIPLISNKLPATLITLVAATVCSSLLNMNVPTIGEIPSSLPVIHLPSVRFFELQQILLTGITLAVLGSLDSLLTSVVADKTLTTRHDSNQELIGQGIGNIAAGLFGGLPGAGATMRTMVNIKAGGRTKISGMFHSLVLLTILLSLGKMASLVPLPVLAGILISVGLSIIDYRSLRNISKTPGSDVAVMSIVLFLTVFVDLIIAVLVGVCLACALFVRDMSEAQLSEHGHLDTLDQLFEIAEHLSPSTRKEIYTYTFNGPLFFGEVKNFQAVMQNIEYARYFILRFTNVPIVDQSGAFALEEAEKFLETRGTKILFVGIRPDIKNRLVEMNVIKPNHSCFLTLEEAVEFIEQNEISSQSHSESWSSKPETKEFLQNNGNN